MSRPDTTLQAPSRAPLFPGADKCGGCGRTLKTDLDAKMHFCAPSEQAGSSFDPVEVLPGAHLSDRRTL